MIKGIASALFSIFGEGKYADKVVPVLLKTNPQWGSRDRRFVAENCYEIVRYWRYYWYLLQMDEELSEEALIKLVGIRLTHAGYELPELPEFTNLPEINNSERPQHAIAESYPDWLYQLGENSIGNNWLKEASALNERANVFLRVNTSKISPQNALKSLAKDSVTAELVEGFPSCLKLEGRVNLEGLELIKSGQAELQDAGSQLISQFLQPTANSFIVDACAGSGGKTLHIADLIADKGKIVAMDIEHWKLNNLQFRAKKSKFHSISTIPLPNKEFFENNALKVDYLLIDAPCSGLGVIKRNPDTKWKITKDRIEELVNIQQDILIHYSVLVKSGGTCVYATCSILPQENHLQVEQFLKSNPDFELQNEHMQWPSQGTDGFYMARLKRK